MVEKRLSDMEAGGRGEVTRIEGSGALKRRIMDMGIVGGANSEDTGDGGEEEGGEGVFY